MPDAKTRALQLNMEGLLKLLGGSASDRERFWEIFKGITTPRELKLINSQLDHLAVQVKTVQTATKNLQQTAKQIASR